MSTPFDQPSTLAKSSDPEGGDGAYSFDGKPDRWKRYRLPDPETGKATGYTRATTFAKSISDTFTLSQWSQRTGGYGLVLRPDLLAALAAAWPDREKCNKIMEEAKNAAGAKVGANLGTALHAFSEAIDRGEKPNIPPPYQPHMVAYTALMRKYGLEAVDIEKVVLCQTYGIAGTFDRIVRFTRDVTVELINGGTYTFKKGTLAILDLKTGKDLEYGWLEISIQLAIYANAEVIWDKEKMSYSMMYPEIDRKVALVVHLPATAPGESVKATMYAVDIEAGWEEAELCAKVREARKRKGLATALSVVEEAPAPTAHSRESNGNSGQLYAESPIEPGEDPSRDAGSHRTFADANPGVDPTVRPPTFVERAQTARAEADLTAIWFEAMRQRKDDATLRAAIQKRRLAILADTAAG